MKAGMLDSVDYYDLSAPYNMINSMYNRIIELRYKANLNFAILNNIEWNKILDILGEEHQKIKVGKRRPNPYFDKNGKINWESFSIVEDKKIITPYFDENGKIINESFPPNENPKDPKMYFSTESDPQRMLEFLILDSIFCFHEIIKSCHIYGLSYMINHSLLGYAHMHFGDWCTYFEAYQFFLKDSIKENRQQKEKKTAMDAQLRKLIGAGDLPAIQSNYHYEMALRHFRKAKETHSQGKAYREMIEGVHYLNDDFNDTLPHFCAAMERYQINCEKIDKKIVALKQKVKSSTLYSMDYYLPPHGK
jgi:hypothetical protein